MGRALLLLCASAVCASAAAAPFFAWGGPQGGDGADVPLAVAAAPDGMVVMASVTGSGPPGAGRPPDNEGVAILRYDASGGLMWVKYLAGNGRDGASGGLHVGNDGTVTFAFTTASDDLPMLLAFQELHGGGDDVYFGRLDPGGTLVRSSYFGGAGTDTVAGVAVHAGRVSIGLTTDTADLPSTIEAHHGGRDAYVVSFPATLDSIVRATYVGSSGEDLLAGIAARPAETDILLAGSTDGAPFAPDPPGWDGFIARVGTTVQGIQYGGDGDDRVMAVALADQILVAGQTFSTDLPVLLPAQDGYGGQGDAFLATFDDDLVLQHASYLGGTRSDAAYGAAWFEQRAVLVGATLSGDFPTAQPRLPYGGEVDGFIALIEPGAVALSTHIGGCGVDVLSMVAPPSPSLADRLPVLGYTYGEVPGVGGGQSYPGGLKDLYVLSLVPANLDGPAALECPEGDGEGWADTSPPDDAGAQDSGADREEPEEKEGCTGDCGCMDCPPPPPCGPPIEAAFAERIGDRVRITWNGPRCGEMAVFMGATLVARVPSTQGQAWNERPYDATHAYRLVWNQTAGAITNLVPAKVPAKVPATQTTQVGAEPTDPDLVAGEIEPGPDVEEQGPLPWAALAATLLLPLVAVLVRRL